MKRIKVKANAMEDANVRYVSLVSRPASRLPFRVLKHDEPDQENGLMINLSRMFKRDGDATEVGVSLVGVVLQKAHRDHFAPQLEKLGLKTDDVIESDDGDVLIFRQQEFNDDDVVAIKLNELGGLFINMPEEVTKAFDPFVDSDDFGDNMSLQFLPGMSAATEALLTSVVNVLRTADTPDNARERISTNIDAYKAAVMDMAANLPEMAFKIEQLTLEGFEPAEVEKEDDQPVDAEASAEPVQAEGETVEKEEGEAAPEPAEVSDGAEAQPEAQAEADALKEKGVHIEGDGADDIKNPDVTTEASTEAPEAAVEKSEGEDDKGLDALVAKMSEVLEAVSGVRSEVADLKESQTKLAEKVDAVEETAEKARKAVKGTVPTGSDANDHVDESLGTHRRNRKSDADADERAWGGTSLDRIVGDFGS